MAKFQVLSDLIELLAKHKQEVTMRGQNAWSLCDFSLSEPKIVKSFTLDPDKGAHYLNSSLATNFNNSQLRFVLKFAGIYAHQRPYVSRDAANCAKPHQGTNSTKSCELADLVFLSVLVDQKKNVITSRASFFQAKKKDAIDNQTQRWLYDYDDHFLYTAKTFWERTSCNSPKRIMPDWDEERSTAFQYLILDEDKANVRLSPWNVDHRHNLVFFYIDFLLLQKERNIVRAKSRMEVGPLSSMMF